MRDRHLPSVIQELLRAQRNQILVGPNWLGAPGGYLGHLPQDRVNFEDNERVCLDLPTSGSVTSGSTLIDNLNRIRAWLSPAKWFMSHATEPPSMYVYVEPGIAYLHGTTGSPIVFPGGFTSGSFEHNSSGSPRIDLLYLEGNTGTLQIKQGTPSSSPVAPWPISGSPFPIAEVYMRHCSGSIFNKCSSGSATSNYIYRDVRPFITFPGAGTGGGGGGLVNHTHTAIDGGQLDWDDIWTDGVHTHQAAGEGGQLDHGAATIPASLLDDDHTQYIKDVEYTAKGDILAGTGAGAFSAQALGDNYQFLMANGAQADGVQWHYAPFWKNVVVVDPQSGDYTTVTAALAAITTASATNRFAIFVMADVGGEAVTLKDYVDIIGIGTFATGASATPIGLLVTGSVTDVAIHNMLLATITGAENYSVNLTGGNVEFHGCRFAKSIYIQGGSHKFYECSMVVSSGLGLNIISSTQVDIFGGEYLNSDSGGEYAIRGDAGTINLYGVRARATGAFAGADGILCNGATINVYGGSIYGYDAGINADSGAVNLYGGISVTGGTDDINTGGGLVRVYAASYDPDNVTGTPVGADKDTVIGDLTVIDNARVNTINEYTTAAGVTIDGVKLKDNIIDTASAVPFAALATSAKGFVDSVAADSGQTSNVTAFEDMTNGSITVVIPAGMTADVFLTAISTAKCDTAGKVSYLQIDWNAGATVGSKGSESEGANQYVSIAVAFPVLGVAAGSYVAKLRKSTQTAGNVSTYYGPQLDVIVIPT